MSQQNDSLEFAFDIDYHDPLAPFLVVCPNLAPLQTATDFLQQQFEEYNKIFVIRYIIPISMLSTASYLSR